MKKLMLAVMLSFPALGYAACNPDNNGGTCNEGGIPGPQGVAGANGVDGINGRDGNSVSNKSVLVLDTAIRLIDTKYFQLQAFNVYNLARGNKQHSVENGSNYMYGARVVFKLGQSHEEREIQKLRDEIKLLSR